MSNNRPNKYFQNWSKKICWIIRGSRLWYGLRVLQLSYSIIPFLTRSYPVLQTVNFLNPISPPKFLGYSSLTLVLAFCEGSHISPKNKFSSFFTLYIVPHISPRHKAFAKKISKIFFEKFMSKKWKIYEKLVTHFIEFIGLLVCKTTGSISPLFLLKKIAKKCLVSRDICKTSEEKWSKKCKNLWIQGIFSHFFFQQE